MKKKKARLTIGPFLGWRVCYLPKCVYPQNKTYSIINLGKKQRDFVLKKYGYGSYASYLKSNLWASIRYKILCNAFCVCGNYANQVHHKSYTEANLLGKTQRGLIAICQDCHYGIEFSEERKCSLGEANRKLKEQQFESVADMKLPNSEEIKLFLSGKKMPDDRKLVVRRHLKIAKERNS